MLLYLLLVVSVSAITFDLTTKVRVTKNNNRCKLPFVYNKTLQFDCVSEGGSEWCYVIILGKQEREECSPTNDFNKLRVKQSILMENTVNDNNNFFYSIQHQTDPSLSAINYFKSIKTTQADLQHSMSLLLDKIQSLQDISENVDKLMKEEVLLEKSKHVLDFNVRNAAKIDNSCSSLINENPKGDGLNAYFFSNEFFVGEYEHETVSEIGFSWSAGTSMPNSIDSRNFSVIYEGFLILPSTDYYTFTCKTDFYCKLSLNNQIIIDIEGRVNAFNSTGKYSIHNRLEGSSTQNLFSAGSKLKIKLKYYFSSANAFEETSPYLALYWETSTKSIEKIPSIYMFSTENTNSLSVSNFNVTTAQTVYLKDRVFLFNDSKDFVVTNVPPQLNNLIYFRFNKNEGINNLSFFANSPIKLYFGLRKQDFSSFSEYLSQTKFTFTVNQLTNQRQETIYLVEKDFVSRSVKVELNKATFVGFFARINFDVQQYLCSPTEVWLSDMAAGMATCEDTGNIEGFRCFDGLNGQMVDRKGSIFAASGAGHSLSIKFNGRVKVNRIEFLNRHFRSERVDKLAFIFEGDQREERLIENTSDKYNIYFDGLETSTMKIEVLGVITYGNNGFAMKVFGFECKKMEINPGAEILSRITRLNENMLTKAKNLFDNSLPRIENLGCDSAIDLDLNYPLHANCHSACLDSELKIFGRASQSAIKNSNQYSIDSVLCKAAYHSGIIGLNGGIVTASSEKAEQCDLSMGELKRGVQSFAKHTKECISFTKMNKPDEIILEKGSLVDFYDNLTSRNWVKAKIEEIVSNKGRLVLTLSILGTNLSRDVLYPYEGRIKPCGSIIPSRDCYGSVKNNYKPSAVLRIKFDTIPNSSIEYLTNNGAVFGPNGFGWTRETQPEFHLEESQEKNFREKSILNNYIAFPPPPNSSKCLSRMNNTNCEPNFFVIKSGKGIFKLIIYSGTRIRKTIAGFKVNEKLVGVGFEIEKGQLSTFSATVESVEEYIYISAVSDSAVINAIELSPLNNLDGERKTACGRTNCTDSQVLHCLFPALNSPGAKYCNGDMFLAQIPPDWPCSGGQGQFKCLKRVYANAMECSLNCVTKCNLNRCEI